MKLRYVGLLILPTMVSAQRVVPVHQEPRHKLVLERADLLVLDVQIPAGDTTLFHTHSTPIHYVMVGASRTNSQVLGRDWPRAAAGGTTEQTVGSAFWTLDYVTAPLTHRVANIGTSTFRLIAVTTLGSGSDAAQAALPGSAEAESRWFRRSRLTLEPGATAPITTGAPVLAVQVSSGRLEAKRGETSTSASKNVGEWMLLEPGASYALRNAGEVAVTLVLVQVVR